MAIQFECDQCFMSYQVADKFAGKKVRCKECQSVVLVPDPAEENWEEGDTVWEDSSFPAPKKKKKKVVNKETPGPVVQKTTTKRSKKREVFMPDPDAENDTKFNIGVGVVVFLVVIVFGYFNPWAGIVAGSVAIFIGQCAVYAHACENECGLWFRIFPPYALYYTLTVIHEVWHWIAIQFAGFAVIIVSMVFMYQVDGGGGADANNNAVAMNFLDDDEEDGEYYFEVWTEPKGDDFENEDLEIYEEMYDPTMEELRTAIVGLPWENESVICGATIEDSGEGEEFNTLHLSKREAKSDPDKGEFSIVWIHYKDNDDDVNIKGRGRGAVFEKLEDAVKVLEAFSARDPEWGDGVEWGGQKAE